MFAFFAIPVGVVLIAKRKHLHLGVGAVLLGMYCFLMIGLSIPYYRSVRHKAFVELAARSQLLVDAIGSFERKYGQPPNHLSELIPEFFTEVPRTGIGRYPTYHYQSKFENPTDYYDNPWFLKVSTRDGMNFDQFLYFPKQNYPEKDFGGTLERIGSWAYVHE